MRITLGRLWLRLANGQDDESDVRQPHGASKSGGDGDLEPGEVAMAYPKSLNDFYKGKW